MIKRSKKNMRGFTLVELLAVIVVIAIIFSIAGYVIVGAIKNSKDKIGEVSNESLKESAILYIEENYGKWNDPGDSVSFEYICVSVFELVNKGYLTEKDISGVEYNYIQINRDKNNKVIIDELVDGEDFFCE